MPLTCVFFGRIVALRDATRESQFASKWTPQNADQDRKVPDHQTPVLGKIEYSATTDTPRKSTPYAFLTVTYCAGLPCQGTTR